MRLLLDTHAFLWATLDDPRLSVEARLLIDGDNDLCISAVTALEIAIKSSRGHLDLPESPDVFMPTRIAAFGLEELPVTILHGTRVARLPHHHADPFDRLLVAQAQTEGLAILTSDPDIRRYDVETIW